jgi:hypothetical protein
VGGVDAAACLSVREMLAAHPAIGTGLDFAVYAEVAELRRRMRRSIERGFIDLFCDAEQLDEQLRAFVDGLGGSREEAGLRVCPGDPDDGARLADLVALFPTSRAIHVVGDPRRAVAAALRDSEVLAMRGLFAGPRRLEAAVVRVSRALDGGFAAGRGAPERVLQISALRLAAEPEPEARRLCGFLGLPWEAAMLRPATRAPRDAASMAAGLSAAARVRIAEDLGGQPELTAHGYPLGLDAMPTAVRLWGWLANRLGKASLAARQRVRALRVAHRDARRVSPSKGPT